MNAIQLATLFFITIFSGTTFILFITWTDPTRLSKFSFFIFYISLLLLGLGSLSILFLFIRRFLFKIYLSRSVFINTVRQGFLLSLFITLSLFLESINKFSLITGLILLIILIAFETLINYYGGQN